MLSQSGAYSQVIHKCFELIAAILVVAKKVEAREAGTEQNVFAGCGEFAGESKKSKRNLSFPT